MDKNYLNNKVEILKIATQLAANENGGVAKIDLVVRNYKVLEGLLEGYSFGNDTTEVNFENKE